MGSQWCLRCPPASVLVHHGHDPLVGIILVDNPLSISDNGLNSIVLPWICTRKVLVDIELVSETS